MKRTARGLLVFGLLTTQGFAAGKADRATCPSGMALIPAGRYLMGQGKSENDVKAFCLDITEVRVADYTRFSSVKRQSKGHFVPDKGTCLGDSSAQFPVNCVDWSQATAFCAASGEAPSVGRGVGMGCSRNHQGVEVPLGQRGSVGVR